MTYVMSDIHGNMQAFESVLEQIDLRPGDTLYVLGDVIDRYPDGIRIMRRIMKMPNARMLLGNHEYMMLDVLDTEYDMDDPAQKNLYSLRLNRWYRNSGKMTHDHLKHLRRSVRREIFDFLRSLPLEYDVTVNGIRYKLVHGCEPERYSPAPGFRDMTEFCVWYRFDSPVSPDDYVLVFGHTVTASYAVCDPLGIWRSADGRMIGIDCGSGWRKEGYDKDGIRVHGRLSCLRLDDMKEFYSL